MLGGVWSRSVQYLRCNWRVILSNGCVFMRSSFSPNLAMAVARHFLELIAEHLNRWEIFSSGCRQQGHLPCGQNPQRCMFLPVGARSSVAFVSHLRCLPLSIFHALSIAARFVMSCRAVLNLGLCGDPDGLVGWWILMACLTMCVYFVPAVYV